MFASHQPLNLQPYTIPSLDDFFRMAEEIRGEYEKTGVKDGRLELITHLETTLRAIKKLHDDKNIYYSESFLRDLAFTEWLACIESIDREYDGWLWPITPDRSDLSVILRKKININKTSDLPISPAQKMTLYNQLYKFEFIDPKADFQAAKLNPENEKERLLKVMRKVAEPIAAMKNEMLEMVAVEKAMDTFLDKIYDLYMAEAKSDNADHRLFARLLKVVRDLNIQDTKERQGFLSHNQRIKMGVTFLILDIIENYKKYSFPWLWSADHSTMHRLAGEVFFGNAKKIPPEVRYECLCAAESYLGGSESRKALEEMLSDRTKFPKEAPVYIHSMLRPLTHKLHEMIEAQVPMQPKLSKTVVTVAAVTAALATMPGIGAGVAIGFGIGLTNPADSLKEHVNPITGRGLQHVFGGGGKILADYGTTIFINETLKVVGGATIGALCAALGALTGATVALTVTEFSPGTIKNIIEIYRQVCNHPQFQPILKQNLFNKVDPEFLACLLESPPELFSEADKEKLKQLSGDPQAMDRLFSHHKTLARHAPKAAQPNQVLASNFKLQ